MAEIHWIKLKTGMFDDEKIVLIQSMPEGDALVIIWIRLLALAGKTNLNGFIVLAENIPYSLEMLSTIFHKPLPIVRMAIETFSRLGMIEVTQQNIIRILNWEKHQNVEGMDKIRLQTRLRVEKYRQKHRIGNVTATLGNGTDSDKDSDKETEYMFNQFWSAYPKKEGKALAKLEFNKKCKSKMDFDAIMKGLSNWKQTKQWNKENGQFINQPKTWLHQEKWNDEICELSNSKKVLELK